MIFSKHCMIEEAKSLSLTSDIVVHKLLLERLNSTAMLVEKAFSFFVGNRALTRSVEESRLRRSAAEKELEQAHDAAVVAQKNIPKQKKR